MDIFILIPYHMLENPDMSILEYISNKYHQNLSAISPVEINASRNDLADWLHDLDFKVGVEVGVAKGEYSEVICQKNPQMKIYGIDPFVPHKGYTDYTKRSTFDHLYQQAQSRLTKLPNYVFLKKFSLDALKQFSDNSLDFVYIDANHQAPFISQDIDGWSKKIRPGGIVSGHDYAADVKVAVDKYVLEHKIRPWFLLVSDKPYSWLWTKP